MQGEARRLSMRHSPLHYVVRSGPRRRFSHFSSELDWHFNCYFMRVGGSYSMKTLVLFLLIQAPLASAFAAQSILEALDAGQAVQVASLSVPATQASPKAIQAIQTANAKIGRFLQIRLDGIRRSRKVYSWEIFSPRDRIPHYCINECACLAADFGPALVQAGLRNVRLLTIHSGRQDYEVRLRSFKGRSASYAFHQVVALKVGDQWFVIDPLMVGNTQPEALGTWLTRIERLNKKTASVVPL